MINIVNYTIDNELLGSRSLGTKSHRIVRYTLAENKHNAHAITTKQICNSTHFTSKLPYILKERELELKPPGANLNKIFTAQWLDERTAIMGTKCNNLVIMDTINGKYSIQSPLKSHPNSKNIQNHCGIHSIAINPSRTFLATGAENVNDVAIYSLPSLEPVAVGFRAHSYWIFDLTWLGDEYVVSGSGDNRLALWKATSSGDKYSLDSYTNSITSRHRLFQQQHATSSPVSSSHQATISGGGGNNNKPALKRHLSASFAVRSATPTAASLTIGSTAQPRLNASFFIPRPTPPSSSSSNTHHPTTSSNDMFSGRYRLGYNFSNFSPQRQIRRSIIYQVTSSAPNTIAYTDNNNNNNNNDDDEDDGDDDDDDTNDFSDNDDALNDDTNVSEDSDTENDVDDANSNSFFSFNNDEEDSFNSFEQNEVAGWQSSEGGSNGNLHTWNQFEDQEEEEEQEESEKNDEHNVSMKRRRLSRSGKFKTRQMSTTGMKFILPTKSIRCTHSKRIRALAYNPKRNEIAAISMNSAFHYFDTRRFEQKYTKKLSPLKENVCLTLNDDYSIYAIGSASHVQLLDANNARPLTEPVFVKKDIGIRSLQFRNSILSVGTGIGTVLFYDLRANKFLTSARPDGMEEQYKLKTNGGWILRNQTYYENLPYGLNNDNSHAIYSHSYDPNGVKLLTVGGPLTVNLYGNYVGLWR